MAFIEFSYEMITKASLEPYQGGGLALKVWQFPFLIRSRDNLSLNNKMVEQ